MELHNRKDNSEVGAMRGRNDNSAVEVMCVCSVLQCVLQGVAMYQCVLR